MRCFEEDEESCLPKRDEVLVVIENMIGGFKLVIYIYIYIYKRACCSSLMREEKKWCLCLVLRFSQPSNPLFVGFFKNLLFVQNGG